jgi:hypothetical protein
MAKVDLLLVTGLTAGDGSIVASGATLKFNSEFVAGVTDVRVTPKLYRNRELFESGYTHIVMSEQIIPDSLTISFSEEDFYGLTPLILYQRVGNLLNLILDGTYFELKIIDE